MRIFVQLLNVNHIILEKLSSSVPVKISGRHLDSIYMNNCYLSSLPWPGIFLYNVTRVSIKNSFFPKLEPKSLSLTLGEEVNVSYNLLDVSNALNMVQYQHMNVKCNRRSVTEKLPIDCIKGIETNKQTNASDHRSEENIQNHLEIMQTGDKLSFYSYPIVFIILLTNSLLGTIFMKTVYLIFIILIIIYGICGIILRQQRREEEEKINAVVKAGCTFSIKKKEKKNKICNCSHFKPLLLYSSSYSLLYKGG